MDSFEDGKEEIFGPVLNLYLYDKVEETLNYATNNQYQLTGA